MDLGSPDGEFRRKVRRDAGLVVASTMMLGLFGYAALNMPGHPSGFREGPYSPSSFVISEGLMIFGTVLFAVGLYLSIRNLTANFDR